ncbi:MAG: DUF488 family protein [Pseudomonadota bacterium]
MMRQIYTIGYEGASLSDFLDTLIDVGIDRVVDIRDVPASRRPGFSKNSLREALAEHDIEYAHLKPLGDPKEGREAMRRGDVKAFQEIFGKHLQSEASQEALRKAVQLANEKSIVLLCFERDPKHCHRTIVANLMSELASFETKHLGVQKRRGDALGREKESRAAVG